jgi:hypothetical protein
MSFRFLPLQSPARGEAPAPALMVIYRRAEGLAVEK